ncbi:hypothetical protein NQZ79_g5558 [Umbelopsis isabellina]|nr:hypothetical protein NQZ79_g5558 [Umbelopsis isabellina]
MSEGVLSRHASMTSSGAISSAEELSQKYQRLFQEYSRIKAQHTVLKKAVVKEQATNSSLQGTVKEKEIEFRKLQEQVDLLKYHNERLTRRIEAVQEKENKGSSFSLLGGAVKKELEKSAQALDAATADLQNKIQENEELHKEMAEINHIYTSHVNGLHQQIADLEKQVEQYKENVSNEQSDTRQRVQVIRQEKTALEAELRKTKEELATKTALLNENEAVMRDSDIKLQGEIETLRSILFSKVGLLDDSTKELIKETRKGSVKSNLTDEAQRQLDTIVEQCKKYINGVKDAQPPNGLTETIAHELGISITTLRDELRLVKDQITKAENEIEQLKDEKQATKDKLDAETGRVVHLQGVVSDLHEKFRQRDELETIKRLETEISELETQIKQQEEELAQSRLETNALKAEEEESHKGGVDQSVQVDITVKTSEKEEESDDETFVYQGVDTPAEKIESTPSLVLAEKSPELPTPEEEVVDVKATQPFDQNYLSPEEVAAREAQLISMYEIKIRSLNESFQLADSKAIRFHRMVQSMKERVELEKENTAAKDGEISRLQAEVLKVQDLLATTESNYKSQLEVMTDFVTELQRELARLQGNA